MHWRVTIEWNGDIYTRDREFSNVDEIQRYDTQKEEE